MDTFVEGWESHPKVASRLSLAVSAAKMLIFRVTRRSARWSPRIPRPSHIIAADFLIGGNRVEPIQVHAVRPPNLTETPALARSATPVLLLIIGDRSATHTTHCSPSFHGRLGCRDPAVAGGTRRTVIPCGPEISGIRNVSWIP